MPHLAWTCPLHQATILESAPLLGQVLGLHLCQRHSCDGYLLLEESGLPRQTRHEAVRVTMRWKDSRSNLCHLEVFSQEEGHPESSRCWELAIKLRRLLA